MNTNQQTTSPNNNNTSLLMNPTNDQTENAGTTPAAEPSPMKPTAAATTASTNSEVANEECLKTHEPPEPQSAGCTPDTPGTPDVPAHDDDDTDASPDEITKRLLTMEQAPANGVSDVPFHKAGRDYHLPQFEVALLSVCLNMPSIFNKVCRALEPGDLYLTDHSEIFCAMMHVHNAGKTISFKKVLRHLVSVCPDREDEWIKLLETLRASSGHFKQIKFYIRELKQAAEIRGGKDFCPHNYSEDFSANLLIARLPEIRCVGKVWYRYNDGVWGEVKSQIFRRDALLVIHPFHRQSRRSQEVLAHVESLAQYHQPLHGAYRFVEGGTVLINAANCVVRVSAQGAISPLEHSPDFDFTRKLAASYDPTARYELFGAKLAEIVPDPEDREVFQNFCGYMFYPSCKFETAFVAYGPGGTGKGTMATVIAEVLGTDLVGSSGLEELCKIGSYSLPKLKLKMLNLGSELTGKEAVESANFKKLVSGEAMDVREIYGAPEEMRTTCKFLFLSNNLPRFYCGTDAETRRLRILHFDKKPQTIDPDLKGKLSGELSGILNWMVEGLVKLLQSGKIPQGGVATKAVLNSFSNHNDPVGSFVTERCILGPNRRVVKRDLLDEFTDWCNDNGLPVDKLENFFWKTLLQRHPELTSPRLTINGRREHCIMGIELVTPREESPEAPANTGFGKAPWMKGKNYVSPALLARVKAGLSSVPSGGTLAGGV